MVWLLGTGKRVSSGEEKLSLPETCRLYYQVAQKCAGLLYLRDCGHWLHAVWFWSQHHWCHLHHPLTAGEVYHCKHATLFAFFDFGKTFDIQKSSLVGLEEFGVKDWAVHIIKCMYMDVRNKVRVNGQYSEELVCTRDLSSAPCFSALCLGPCCASSLLVCHRSFLCRRPCSNGKLTGRIHCYIKGVEKGRTQRTESKHIEDKDHDLQTWD